MNPLQVVIRDLFGTVVFNQIFPNLPLAASSISLFIRLWRGPISQVLLIFPKKKGEFDKTIFKIREAEDGQLFLAADGEETVMLPNIPEDVLLDHEGDFEDPDLSDEDDDDEGPPF